MIFVHYDHFYIVNIKEINYEKATKAVKLCYIKTSRENLVIGRCIWVNCIVGSHIIH